MCIFKLKKPCQRPLYKAVFYTLALSMSWGTEAAPAYASPTSSKSCQKSCLQEGPSLHPGFRGNQDLPQAETAWPFHMEVSCAPRKNTCPNRDTKLDIFN